MSAQPNLILARGAAAMPKDGPHPAALQAIGLVEQALAELLSSLHRQADASAPDSPGAIEYASWLRRDR
jgi:hypothetical protein